MSDGTFVGVELSMDVQIIDEDLAAEIGLDANETAIAALERDDSVDVVAVDPATDTERNLGTYRFVRRLPKVGDESGLLTVELAYS